MHNVCVFRDDFKPFFLIHTEAKRTTAGNNRAMRNFTVKNNVDSFPVNISFILGYGQFHIDI